MAPLKICLVSSEVAPFAKTGGLADVSAAVSRYLDSQGHDVLCVMPEYRRIRQGEWQLEPHPGLQKIPVELGGRSFTFSVSRCPLPTSGVNVHMVHCPELYGRDGIYTSDPDEHLRFALLNRAAIEICQRLHWPPDVFHCNDWHTGLIPLYLQVRYSWDELFANTKTVLTLHNIGYQGVFSTDVLGDLGLADQRQFLYNEDTEGGVVNFLKTGLLYADALTTVSETYAREIQSEELGMGLDELLRARSDRLFGIVNGVDYSEWNPATDQLIPFQYTPDDLSGKEKNKRHLLEDFGLSYEEGVPLFGAVSRLTAQKGFELLPDILPVFLKQRNMRLVVLGSGEQRYEDYFQWLHETFPSRVGFYCGYSNELAHRIEAASDMFLMPSRYEPCGLNQMYSLKYGTAPIVRSTGGLADTVRKFDPETGSGDGFPFDDFSAEGLFGAIDFAFRVYEHPPAWRKLVANAMAADWSWERQGRHYVELYRKLIS